MSDTSRHLTYFKVENFKRFESFEMDNLGQFNLIVGDNNVGKTSVLEALLACKPAWIFKNTFSELLKYKNSQPDLIIGDFISFLNRNKTNSTRVSIRFHLGFDKTVDEVDLIFEKVINSISFMTVGEEPLSESYDHQINSNSNAIIPFIPFYKGYDTDLVDFYPKLQESRILKENFTQALRVLIDSIINIDLSLHKNMRTGSVIPYPIIYQNHVDYSIPLSSFGDGTIKLFRIIAWIVMHPGQRIMIDEIDAGIHYSRMKEFWKVILKAAKDNDVQLFMTTHNIECIRYFSEILEEELQDFQTLSRGISLVENSKTKQVTAHTYPYDQLQHAINVGNEIRA